VSVSTTDGALCTPMGLKINCLPEAFARDPD
jgi:hypothetical protein